MKRRYIRYVAGAGAGVIIIGLLGFCAMRALFPASIATPGETDVTVYEVDKTVSEFPAERDLSTPEKAYAAVSRALAEGDPNALRRISVKELADRWLPADAAPESRPSKEQEQLLEARVVEVRVFRDTQAAVIARLPGKRILPDYEVRRLTLEEGQWRSRDRAEAPTLGRARALFAQQRESLEQQMPARPAVSDPNAHLQQFVQFLEEKAEEPKTFVMRALATHKVVVIGEVHHRLRYWLFNAALVTDPNFPHHVGTIYLELPSHAQPLIDGFLASPQCDTAAVIEMLRDNLWMGWPDQAMLYFFQTVWMVNQDLQPEQRLRIVLVDMQRPWSKIEVRPDWKSYEVDRDQFMARNIVRDIQARPDDTRNNLFIVGVGHAPLLAKYLTGWPILTSGWYLRQELDPENVYAILQHRPVMTNMGRVDGRLCLGLFESAFDALDNRPMAFPLDTGPFGKEPYDADPDRPVGSTFGEGFSAYLYLGPLETEAFSPLIAGFYTEAFVRELDRRHMLMFDQRWAEAYGQGEMTPEAFTTWMGDTWGRPRRDWRPEILGPLDDWHRGGRVQREVARERTERPEDAPHLQDVIGVAREIFHRIQNADYDRFVREDGSWGARPAHFPTAGLYIVQSDYGGFVKWICTHFRDNPIVALELGEVFMETGPVAAHWYCPTVPYTLTLKDGTVLKGNLSFVYDARMKQWQGIHGLDWHLPAPDEPKSPTPEPQDR